MINRLDKLHLTRIGYAVFGLVELALTYVFGSLALNSGSIWEWVLTFILALGTIQNFVKTLLVKASHGNKH